MHGEEDGRLQPGLAHENMAAKRNLMGQYQNLLKNPNSLYKIYQQTDLEVVSPNKSVSFHRHHGGSHEHTVSSPAHSALICDAPVSWQMNDPGSGKTSQR